MTPSLNRRDFVKSAAAGIAGAYTEGSLAAAVSATGQRVALENGQIGWDLSKSDGKLASTGLRNKISGRNFPLRQTTELALTLSAAKERVEIPWWHCSFGPEDDPASPETESGLKQGYSRADFDDSMWQTCSNLGLRGLSASAGLKMNQGRPPVAYSGYGWFRTPVALSAAARGQEIVLTLGGYDETDWKQYWIYVNGIEIGQRKTSERWPSPDQFRLSPQSPGYEALRFGAGDANVLAVRTHSYDRHYGGLSDDILDRHMYDPILHDQFVTVGAPYTSITEFELLDLTEEKRGSGSTVTAKLSNRALQVNAVLHYELEGPIRRKWAEVQNAGKDPILLLDISLDNFDIEGSLAGGGYGYPLTVGNQVFIAVEHPSGFSRWHGSSVLISHFPGKVLKPGETWRSNNSIVGVAAEDQAERQFVEYLEAHSVRKNKLLALYDPFGVTAFTEGTSWALNEEQNLGTLDVLEQWQKRGIHFDHYVPDMSLDTTPTSDLKKFRLFSFPDGPQAMVERINNLGMKFGQWFSVTMGAWSNVRNPKMAPSRIPVPQGSPYPLFRNGYLSDMTGQAGDLCVASEPYFSTLRDAVVHHIQNNHVELVKFDAGDYYCNSTQHGHLAGKYSTEQCLNRLVALASAARTANPDVFVDWYWGAYSPFLALHGDVIFDIRISMEAASTGDYPALFFRDAVTQALDQGSQYARLVPPKNHDSLGVWMANNWWGNQMGTVRWQEAMIMDLARGNLLFPQVWGDINNLEDHDVEFLARLQALAKSNEPVFLTRRYTIGDAWRDAIYGYSYFQGTHGFVFLNNVSFESRTIRLALGEQIGLKAAQGQPVSLQLHHPERTALTPGATGGFKTGGEFEIQLRPFEVAMIEVTPGSGTIQGLPARDLMESSPIYSYALPLKEQSGYPDLEIHFTDAALLQGRGLTRRFTTFEGVLPEYGGHRHHIAVVSSFSLKGKRWRQAQMNELVQATAEVDGTAIEFTSTPDYRQISNNQWNPWIVFSAPLPSSFAGKTIRFGISAYLPEGVEVDTELWAVREWWRPRRRSLPNYWV